MALINIKDQIKTSKQLILDQRLKRTSSLLSPIMVLQGQAGEIYDLKFNPNGEMLASASKDGTIFFWEAQNECSHLGSVRHKNAVLGLSYSPNGDTLVSCSADKTINVWDLETLKPIRHLTQHHSYVNCVSHLKISNDIFVSCSDDCTVKIWDYREPKAIKTVKQKYPVFTCALSSSPKNLYFAGLDNVVKVYDFSQLKLEFILEGHTDSVTGIDINPEENSLASVSMDGSLKIWDIRPFYSGGGEELKNEQTSLNSIQEELEERQSESRKCHHSFNCLRSTIEQNLIKCQWNSKGNWVASGSGDRFLYVFDVEEQKILYKLPGHTASVNSVAFHPKEPIIASAGSDRKIYLGELMKY
ncbi:u5 small nuclear ribonucleoprotein 40 kda protein [Anaeramoeba flamelloides]|uniref:U5 small nuclear ribonucleoprotein 40 kDa protein n=1 Tax=Anaeramoeba flamelloides TaxID=1746091 RepID=A0ABQ8Z1U5_9EUKA|nr:u5 small nuclear ribonucleoprotein 40 kda protein [Anaeramoeba flamelloides]